MSIFTFTVSGCFNRKEKNERIYQHITFYSIFIYKKKHIGATNNQRLKVRDYQLDLL